MNPRSDSQRIAAEVEALMGRATNAHEELLAALARYLCVLASSYLEASLRELAIGFASRRASADVVRYVDHALSGFRDPNCEKILQLVGRFNDDYRRLLDHLLDDKLKASVDSICANRNNIAHGRRSGVSFSQVRAYYEDALVVVSTVESVLAPPAAPSLLRNTP